MGNKLLLRNEKLPLRDSKLLLRMENGEKMIAGVLCTGKSL
jgi:hypothetical protein